MLFSRCGLDMENEEGQRKISLSCISLLFFLLKASLVTKCRLGLRPVVGVPFKEPKKKWHQMKQQVSPVLG